MSLNDIENFIGLIKKDINQIKAYFSEKYGSLLILIPKKTKFVDTNFNILIDFEYFKKLIEEKCYTLRFSINSDIGTKLEKRLMLFNNIFLSNLGKIDQFAIHRHWSTTEISDPYQDLFLKLIFSILQKHLNTGDKINDIFLEFLEVWNNSMKSEKFPIKVLIQLPNIIIREDKELLKNKIYVKTGELYYLCSHNFSSSINNALLIYKTEFSFKIYTSIKDYNSHFVHYNNF